MRAVVRLSAPVFCLISVSCSAAAQTAPVLDSLARAMEMQRQGKLDESAAAMQILLKQAEREEPGSESVALVLHNLGCVYQEMHRYEESRACLLRAIHLWRARGQSGRRQLIRAGINLITTYVEGNEAEIGETILG